MQDEAVRKLKQVLDAQRPSEIAASGPRQITVDVARTSLRKAIAFLKREGFAHLSTITGLEADASVELLYHFSAKGIMLTVHVTVPLADVSIPTITDIVPGASLYEREVHDLLGVKFEGHPNLQRLILPDDWPEGDYPLRKKAAVANDAKETASAP